MIVITGLERNLIFAEIPFHFEDLVPYLQRVLTALSKRLWQEIDIEGD